MKFVASFFILIICSSIFSQNVVSHRYEKTAYSNGTLKTEKWILSNSNNLYIKYYYEDGSLKKDGWFKNNLKEKILEVLCKW